MGVRCRAGRSGVRKPGKAPSRREALPRPLPQAGGEKRGGAPAGREGRARSGLPAWRRGRVGEASRSAGRRIEGAAFLPGGRPRIRSFDCRRLSPPSPPAGEAGWGSAAALAESVGAARQSPVAPGGPPPSSRKREGRKRDGPSTWRQGRKDDAAAGQEMALPVVPIAGGPLLLPRLRGRPGGGLLPRGRKLRARLGKARSRREALPRPLPQAGGEDKGEALLPGGSRRFRSVDCRKSSFLLPRLRGKLGGGLRPCWRKRRARSGKDSSRREALPRPLPQAGGEEKGAALPVGRLPAVLFCSPACGGGRVGERRRRRSAILAAGRGVRQPGGSLAVRAAASRRSWRSSQDANSGVVSLPT